VRGLDLVDEPHPLSAQYRQVDRFFGDRGDILDSRAEYRGDVRAGGAAESEQPLPQGETAIEIGTHQTDLVQADQQAPNRRLSQSQALAKVDQTQLSRLSGDLVQGGRRATQHLDSFVAICRCFSFPLRH
jgi:hypothetical protein